MSLTWTGDTTATKIAQGLSLRVRAVCIMLTNACKETLSRPGRTGFALQGNSVSRGQIAKRLSKTQGLSGKALDKATVAAQRLQRKNAVAKALGKRLSNRSSFARYGGDRQPFWRKGNGGRDQSKIVGGRIGNSRLLSLMTRSRPGEPPRRQTGQLRASVTYQMTGTYVGRVGTNVKHGRYMEFGVRGGKIIRPKNAKVLVNFETRQFFGKAVKQGRIAPRPWLLPTVTRTRQRMVEYMIGAGVSVGAG